MDMFSSVRDINFGHWTPGEELSDQRRGLEVENKVQLSQTGHGTRNDDERQCCVRHLPPRMESPSRREEAVVSCRTLPASNAIHNTIQEHRFF